MQNPHILIVEDEAVTRNTLRSIFEAEGYVVTEANDGAEMHKAMQENKIIFLEKNTQLIQKNGCLIYIDDSGAPIHDSEGNVIGSVLIFRDITEKRKTEEKLNLIYNQSLDMIGVANKEGYFISINPAVTKILGYTQEEFLSQSYFDFIHPDDINRTDNEKHTLFENIDTLDFVNRYRSKDGTYRWIEWNVTMVDELMYAMGRDITERKEAYEMIAETHKKFFQILESSPVAIIITEIENRNILYANDAFCMLSGFDKKALVGKTPLELGTIKPEESEKIRKNLKEEGGHKRDIESQLKRSDGTVIDVLFSVESIEIEGKTCYIGTFVDITERKKSEINTQRMNLELEKRVKKRTAQIEKQKQFTDEILNKIPTEIAVYDSAEKYLYVNPKGIESQEIRDWVIGKTDFDLCKLKGLDPALAEKRQWSFQNISKNESVEWIDEIPQEDGSTHYMLRILHPLDKKKKFEMELEVKVGRGFLPGDENKKVDQPIGVIAIDSLMKRWRWSRSMTVPPHRFYSADCVLAMPEPPELLIS